MRKFFRGVVNHPKIIITVFILVFLVCLVFRQLVSVNYDVIDYLPEDSPSTVSMDVMDTEFGSGIPNTRVMIKNVTIPQALAYKEKLLQIDGVADVMWLDDSADITVPLEMMDSDAASSFYKNNAALFLVTIREEKLVETTNAIRDLIGNDNAMSGSDVSLALAMESGRTETGKTTVFAVVFVLLVLVLTTTSWAEPLIVMAGLGVAVIVNAGSNLIFGELSFLTNSAGNVLQIAVSLDYSVFLLHRFQECRSEMADAKEAMVEALCKSTSSILSSGLTTVIGFLALVLMQFRIGPDLGLALAKGIAISLLSALIFLPALIVVSYKQIEKVRHRPFIPNFRTFGKIVRKAMIPLVCLFAVLIVPAYLASNANGFYYGASFIFGENTQLGADTAEIEEVFGKKDTYVLLVPKGRDATEKELSVELRTLPRVTGIVSYVDSVGEAVPKEYLDPGTLSKLVSDHYSRMVISVNADYEGEKTFSLVENIRDTAEKYYPESYYMTGQGVCAYDLMKTVTSDMVKVNLIAIGAVFIVLLVTMRSVLLPVLLVLSIEAAVWINLSIPYFESKNIFYTAYLIISSVQLGATVDYAILFTVRYKEFREAAEKKQAVAATISAVSPSILTSGIVLTMVGFLLGYISTHGVISQLGFLLGRGSLLSIAITLLVLPGLLYIFDGPIQHTTRGINFLNQIKEVR
jgi:predicted RND superfamily exporter protein